MVSEAVTPWWRCLAPVELLDPLEMAEADRLAVETVPSLTLMERAGAAVADAARRLLPVTHASRYAVVLCGPGNNGGDGYVAARLLAEEGVHVTVATLGGRHALKGDAAAAASRWSGPVVPLSGAPIDAADLTIDALFGAGLARDITGDAKDAIDRVNAQAVARRTPVLAVDVPSGIDGATGMVRGTAIRATETITFFRLKPGHVLMPGRVHCGAILLADIGIPPSVLGRIEPNTFLNAPALWRRHFPIPRLEGHKYARGHVLVVSGPLAQTGAARLCARGALRAGAGLVTVATPEAALPVHAATLTAIMTRVADSDEQLAAILDDRRKNAVVLGPGLGVGAATRAMVQTVLSPAPPGSPPRYIVLDADALANFADEPRSLFDAIANAGHVVALTPHDGEFVKLFGSLIDMSQAKPQRARGAAAVSGAIVVLKGPDTVVAHPDGRATIASSEAPWLATAGSGDVLAGTIAGLMAQAMPPFEACGAGVWLHAEAARLYGPGLISEDLPDTFPRVLSKLLAHDLIDGM